jgi:hypothetical protein
MGWGSVDRIRNAARTSKFDQNGCRRLKAQKKVAELVPSERRNPGDSPLCDGRRCNDAKEPATAEVDCGLTESPSCEQAGVSKNVPQPGRPRFDEFLELERRDSDFVGVNRAAPGRPFP